MDTGEGRFEITEQFNKELYDQLLEKCPKAKGVFRLGEELEIKGSRFKITTLNPTTMRLRLLPTKA